MFLHSKVCLCPSGRMVSKLHYGTYFPLGTPKSQNVACAYVRVLLYCVGNDSKEMTRPEADTLRSLIELWPTAALHISECIADRTYKLGSKEELQKDCATLKDSEEDPRLARRVLFDAIHCCAVDSVSPKEWERLKECSGYLGIEESVLDLMKELVRREEDLLVRKVDVLKT
eukprot:PhF_6_TR44454/c0_g1_i1/m.68429